MLHKPQSGDSSRRSVSWGLHNVFRAAPWITECLVEATQSDINWALIVFRVHVPKVSFNRNITTLMGHLIEGIGHCSWGLLSVELPKDRTTRQFGFYFPLFVFCVTKIMYFCKTEVHVQNYLQWITLYAIVCRLKADIPNKHSWSVTIL